MAWKNYLDKGYNAIRTDSIPHEDKYPGGKRYMSVSAIEDLISKTDIYQSR
jgi:hypothetical protein